MKTLRERFDDKVAKVPFHSCWEWVGCMVGGYGQIGSNRKVKRAHRVAWEFANGPIPPGSMVLHKCDNPACVNPDHLFLGSNMDNVLDAMSKDRHSRGTRNGKAKLCDEDVVSIVGMLAAGLSQDFIARAYGVDQLIISRIKRGLIWKHVKR